LPLNFGSNNALDLFRDFLENVKETENYVRVVIDYSVESAIAGGLLCKALKELDIMFELINNLMEIPIDETRQFLINTKVSSGGSALALAATSTSVVRKTSTGYVIGAPVLEEVLLNIISDYVIIPKEVKYLLASSVLARHTPRLVKRKLSASEEKFLGKLEDDDLIKKVIGPMIMGWNYLKPEVAVKYSVDLLVPKYFMRDLANEISDEVIANELGLPREQITGNNYIIRQEWYVKDLYYLAYLLMCIVDENGVEVLAATVLNPGAMVWYALKMYEYLRRLRTALDEFLAGDWESRGKYRVMHMEDPPPLTMLTKVLQNLGKLGRDEVIANELAGKVHVPIQMLSQKSREILRTEAKVVGGYAIFPSTDVLSKVGT